MNDSINILQIIRGTTVDGPGFRTSIYFAGCRHECPGCHNPSSWDFNAGTPYSIEQLMEIIKEEDFDVTLSGGDPLYHPRYIKELSARIHSLGHDVWLYTGFRWEEIIEKTILFEAIREVDVIVDSPFVLALRDPDLLFRGSSNQRIIDVGRSLLQENGKIIEWKRDDN
ncbi:MAG: anaerobic ribonucleoside-triphosphate reductase activating protein [Muribaculaceae bacterium]|nr:anaerobic ribonucleoside-triphosphate reductase activating protein [Muribaculaceae bacterium]